MKLREIIGIAADMATRVGKVFDLRDMHAYGGLLMLWYGLYMVYPAAAWAMCGALMFWLGVRR